MPTVALKDASFKEFLSANLHEFLMRSSCGKFFKRDIVTDLRFDGRIKMAEDTVFVVNYLAKIHSMFFSDNTIYVYRKLSPALFHIKYNVTPNEGVYTLSQLVHAYKKLDIKSMQFERTCFFVTSVCTRYLHGNPKLWYQNPDVVWIYRRIKSSLGWKFRIKYELLSIPLINRIAGILRDKMKNYQ